MPGVAANPSTAPLPVRYVDDVETLRVLSDPVRLSILGALMEGSRSSPPVRTAKQLAAELGHRQTALYRHLAKLETSGLIEVVEERLVSGIVERSYRAAQRSLRIDEGFLGGQAPMDDALQALSAVLERHRRDLVAAIEAGRVTLGSGPGQFGQTMAALNATIPPERAEAFASRLADLVNEFIALDGDPAGVPVNMLVLFHRTGDKDDTPPTPDHLDIQREV